MLKKHVIYIGTFAEIQKKLKRVKPSYTLNKTKYFEMPSRSIQDQLKELIDNKQAIGMITYCKVVTHREDPIVELVNDFIFIEDIFTVGNEWVEKGLMSSHIKPHPIYRPWTESPISTTENHPPTTPPTA